MTELENFPKGQTLSEMVKAIYDELLKDNKFIKTCEELSKNVIAYKKEDMSEKRNIIELLQNEKYLVTEEICPFKRTKQVYKSTKL